MNTTHFERLRPVVTKVAKAASTPVRWRWSQMLCIFAALLSGTALVREYHVPPNRQPGIKAPKYVTKRIEDIRVGDIVMAWDERTGQSAPKKVTRLYRHETDHFRVLKTRSEGSSQVQEFRTTDEHPFFVNRMGWMKAGELTPGQEVRQFNGQFGLVEISRRERQPKGTLVYNIETEGVHTYFVAQGGAQAPPLLVHNCNKPNARTPLGKPSDSVPVLKDGPQPLTKGDAPNKTLPNQFNVGAQPGGSYSLNVGAQPSGGYSFNVGTNPGASGFYYHPATVSVGQPAPIIASIVPANLGLPMGGFNSPLGIAGPFTVYHGTSPSGGMKILNNGINPPSADPLFYTTINPATATTYPAVAPNQSILQLTIPNDTFLNLANQPGVFGFHGMPSGTVTINQAGQVIINQGLR